MVRDNLRNVPSFKNAHLGLGGPLRDTKRAPSIISSPALSEARTTTPIVPAQAKRGAMTISKGALGMQSSSMGSRQTHQGCEWTAV